MTEENEHIFKEMFDKKENVSRQNKDEIICVVDRSGSMASIREDAEGGLNSFIKEQKGFKNGANLTLVEFDCEVNTVCDRTDINKAVDYRLMPRGSTALLDAIGYIISNDLKYKAEGDGKTIVVVVTDGGENSSKEWNKDDIFNLINTRKDQGWEFIFLAANQDAIQTGQSYGFDASSTASFAATGDGAVHAYGMTSEYATNLRAGTKEDALRSKTAYIDQHSDVLSETGSVDEDKT